jgi:Na+-transporting NADH:ubiquinone oxidoreductase subunit C
VSGLTPESTLKTLGFASGVAFACALLVSATVYFLRPIQSAVATLDQTRAVLEAAQMLNADEALSKRTIIDRFLTLEKRIIDLEIGQFSDVVNPSRYDYQDKISTEAGLRPRYMQSFLLFDQGRLQLLVLPFYGAGMWSTIHGYLALDADLTTVAGIAIHEHGETPGIGDRIQAPEWLAQWRGKRIYDMNGHYKFQITARADAESAAFQVDAITGATITVSGVERAIADWFGSEGYGTFLASLRGKE